MSIAERVERINNEISGVSSMFNVTSWEKEFLKSIHGRQSLSDKQEGVLAKIEEKVFGESDD
jgi:hypothetical protein